MDKKDELYRGKTKAIFATDDPGLVVLQNFDALTKFDDPDQTKQMEGKAVHATRTTCNVFRLLQEAGIPVAFKEQLSDTEFLAEKCQMIPLEVIARRYAVGSYLSRFPNLKAEEGKRPHRFHRLVFELFLKTTGKVIKNFEGQVVGETSVEDPLIDQNEEDLGWRLRHPKLPYWDENSELFVVNDPNEFFPKSKTGAGFILRSSEIERITRKTFLVLEGAWAQLGFRLIDFKIEFGINLRGDLVIADVIDNDSWRLRTSSWEEVSKQCFRDNASMDEIGSKYAMVAKLTGSFRLPTQGVVVWRGSDKDPNLTSFFPDLQHSIMIYDVVLSGHRSPSLCVKSLENALSISPEGGVIIAMVGLSNGLGPMLAARTSWPVITIPLTAEENSLDVWSSLSVPSQVPLLTILSPKNAVLAALNILAQKNPYAYMLRQYEIEKFDV